MDHEANDNPRALDALIATVLDEDGDRATRLEATRALATERSPTTTFVAMVRAINARDTLIRRAAAKVVIKQANSESAVAAVADAHALAVLVDALSGTDTSAARAAALVLRLSGAASALARLTEAIRTGDPRTKIRVIWTQHQISSDDDLALDIARALVDPDAKVRQAAYDVFRGGLSQRQTIAVLHAAASALEENTWLAFRQLKTSDPTTVSDLIAELRDTDVRVRRVAARALESAQGDAVVDALVETAYDKDSSVRAAALRSLGILLAALSPHDWDVAAVTAVVSASADSDPGVRIAAVRALRGATLDTAIDALVAALADTDDTIRSEAADALSRSPVALASPDAEVRLLALERVVLGRRPEALAASQQLRRDPDERVRSLAELVPAYMTGKYKLRRTREGSFALEEMDLKVTASLRKGMVTVGTFEVDVLCPDGGSGGHLLRFRGSFERAPGPGSGAGHRPPRLVPARYVCRDHDRDLTEEVRAMVDGEPTVTAHLGDRSHAAYLRWLDRGRPLWDDLKDWEDAEENRRAYAGGPNLPRGPLGDDRDDEWRSTDKRIVVATSDEREQPYELTRDRRYVNSRLCLSGTEQDVPRDRPLSPDTTYDLLVGIGEYDVRSLLGDAAIFPSELLPAGGLWLTVIVHASGLLDRPEERAIFVPDRGDSFTCPCSPMGEHTCDPNQRRPHTVVPLRTPDNVGTCRVRVVIYYRAAAVHVHDLTLEVGAGAGPRADVSYTLTQSFSDLGPFASRMLSILTHELWADERSRVYVNGTTIPPMSFSFTPGQVDEACRRARSALSDIHVFEAGGKWHSKYDAAGRCDPTEFESDLLRLARIGSDLHASLFTGEDWPQVREMLIHEARSRPAVVQAARTVRERLVVPWQTLYDLPLQSGDDDVYLCESLKEFGPAGPMNTVIRSEAVVGGSGQLVRRPLLPTIPGSCPHEAEHPHSGRSVLCPFGFWGLAYILEVPPHAGEQRGLAHVVTVEGDTPVATLVGVADGLMKAKDSSGEAARHLGTLEHLGLGPLSPPVHSRDELGTRLGPPDMDLVYLYCHGEWRQWPDARAADPMLVLDEARPFTPQDVARWAAYYAWPAPHWPNRRPLVVLNACHSGQVLSDTLADFVSAFSETAGGAGVVATEVSLEQRLAGLAMELLLSGLAGGATVGEAMRGMRWALLARGNLMGLAYSPYCAGDLSLRPGGPT